MPKRYFAMDDDFALEHMRRDTERKTQKDVIRDALTFYQNMLEEIKRGKKIFTGLTRESAEGIVVKQWKAVVAKAKR